MMRFLILVFSGILVAVSAFAQTKPAQNSHSAPAPAKKAVSMPSIKCDDPESSKACKSFKQLMDAKDKDLTNMVLGDPGPGIDTHRSYVCFRPNVDTFFIIQADEPKKGMLYRYPLGSKFLPSFAFLDREHPVSEETKKRWVDEHVDSMLYTFRSVGMSIYADGIFSDFVMDYGDWSCVRGIDSLTCYGDTPTFEGGFAWLEAFNARNKNSLAADDDPEHGHIEINEYVISLHYSFQNKLKSKTDYHLTIQRSTGRFHETFEVPGMDTSEASGSCLIYK